MGDSILIKILNLTILFSLLSISIADELQWVDKQIEVIKPKRKGISSKDIDKLKDPFVFLSKRPTYYKSYKSKKYKTKRYTKTTKTNSTTKLHLEAIMNRSALINQKWYKVGQKVQNFKIKEISPTKVILLKASRVMILSTDTKNTTLKFNK